MAKYITSLFALTGLVHSMPVSHRVPKPYDIQFPYNECGYNPNMLFDTSMNTFSENDTVLFYATDSSDSIVWSNCGPQENSDLGCMTQMYMTNAYSSLGYVPYTVWYNFENVMDNVFVTLRFNYNDTATHVIGTIMCTDSIVEHQYTLDKCMFSQELYSYQFYDYYTFKFYMSCKYVDNQISFYIDQSSDTCVGNGVVNNNKFNLVSFDSWSPVYSNVVTDTDTFCNNCYTTSGYTTWTTETPISTEEPYYPWTTETLTPTPAPTEETPPCTTETPTLAPTEESSPCTTDILIPVPEPTETPCTTDILTRSTPPPTFVTVTVTDIPGTIVINNNNNNV